MDEIIENLDSSTEETSAPVQQPGETKQEFTDRERQLYERLKKAEEKLKETKPLETPKQTGLSIDEKVDLRLEGYSKDDIVAIERAMAGRSLADTLSDPYVKAALDGVRSTRTAEASTPEPSSTIPTFTTEKKTWAQMSPAERKANYQQAIASVQGRKGSRAE